MIFLKRITTVLFFTSMAVLPSAQSALNDFDRQEFVIDNALAKSNPGFESGTVKWTTSGGTFAVNSGTQIVPNSKQYATWDSNSAGQTLLTEAVTVARTGNCEFAIWIAVPSGTSTHTITVNDGTNDIVTPVAITNNTNAVRHIVNFPCPASGTVRGKLTSVASNEPSISVDNGRIGIATNVGSTQLITEPVAYTPVYTGFGTVTNSTARSWRVGSYLFVESYFTIGTATGVEAQMTLGYEGTSGNVTTASNLPTLSIAGHCSGDTALTTYFGNITVLQEASKTYVVFGRHTSGQTGLTKNNGNAFNNSVNVSCSFRVPIQGWAAQTLVMPNAQGWFASGTISGTNPSLTAGDVTAYTEITNASLTLTPDAGSAPMGIMCSSTNAAASPSASATTCSAGSESVGAALNIPVSGVYEACFDFAHNVQLDSAEALYSVFNVIETPTNAQTLTQEGGPRVQSGSAAMTASGNSSPVFPVNACGILTLSSGLKGIRLMYEQATGGTPNVSQIYTDQGAGFGQRSVRFRVRPVNSQQQAILANSVSSANGNGTYFNSAQVGSTGTVTKETGDWISGNCVVASAVATCTLVAGAFTTDPACHATIFGETTSYNAVVTSASTSTVVIRTFDTANAAAAAAFGLTCSSPR